MASAAAFCSMVAVSPSNLTTSAYLGSVGSTVSPVAGLTTARLDVTAGGVTCTPSISTLPSCLVTLVPVLPPTLTVVVPTIGLLEGAPA